MEEDEVEVAVLYERLGNLWSDSKIAFLDDVESIERLKECQHNLFRK